MASETVTQADREAAAEFAESIATRSKSERAEILRGDADLDCYVQAFAAHRTAAVAELAEALQAFLTAFDNDANYFGDECARAQSLLSRHQENSR